MALPEGFVEGVFFAVCQRPPTNRELASIARHAIDKRDVVHFLKNMPEAGRFFNNFYGLSFNWINFRLAVGEYPSPFQADLLVEDGITHFINVTNQDLPYVDILPDSISYSAVPLANDKRNSKEDMAKAAKLVLCSMGSDDRTYLHCFSGISRSAAVAAIAIGAREGLNYRQAMDLVRGKRPLAHPHPSLVTLAEANAIIKQLGQES